jgi:dihydroxyacetone kinase-like predicted kinase
MQKYHLEFILHAQEGVAKNIRNALAEFSEALEIVCGASDGVPGENFCVRLNTEDPTVIFDLCSQFGRIRQAKVDEIK